MRRCGQTAGESRPGWHRIGLQPHHEAGGDALIALHQPADLAVHRGRIERLLRPCDAPGQAFERGLDPLWGQSAATRGVRSTEADNV